MFEGIPNDELSKLMRINIPDFKIDLTDIWLESDLSKSLIAHRGKIEFNINPRKINYYFPINENMGRKNWY